MDILTNPEILAAAFRLLRARERVENLTAELECAKIYARDKEDELVVMVEDCRCSSVEQAAHQAVERPEVEAGSSEVGRGDFGDEGVATSNTLQTS